MSNLMKFLGSEATQDPTTLEREIQTAAAEREQAHMDRNIARKLTSAERQEKKERNVFYDPTTRETIVSVYKNNDLSHKHTRFKVDVNAQENRLIGCAVISDGIRVVVVEGESKSIKRYGKLMLHRINWSAAVNDGKEEEDDGEDKLQTSVCCCGLEMLRNRVSIGFLFMSVLQRRRREKSSPTPVLVITGTLPSTLRTSRFNHEVPSYGNGLPCARIKLQLRIIADCMNFFTAC